MRDPQQSLFLGEAPNTQKEQLMSLMYKCRLCGETYAAYKIAPWEGVAAIWAITEFGTSRGTIHGIKDHAKKQHVHTCGNGFGVSDLIGAVEGEK